VSLLVGASKVRDHGELVRAVLEQDRVMRRDQPTLGLADQRRPRVLKDQLTDDLGVLRRVVAVVPHLRHSRTGGEGRRSGAGPVAPLAAIARRHDGILYTVQDTDPPNPTAPATLQLSPTIVLGEVMYQGTVTGILRIAPLG
jgi:hypothetical protein